MGFHASLSSATCRFSGTNISQGSVAIATHLMFVGILNYCFAGNLTPNLPVKECLNWLALGKVKGKSRVVLFSGHGVSI